MREHHQPTRRRSLHAIGLGLGGLSLGHPSVLAALQHAHQAAASPSAKFTFLTPEMAADLESVAAQIIPSGATPGAREAGVVYFIDRALATFDRSKRGLYRDGLAQLDELRLSRHSGSKSFASLASADQIELLKSIETTDFFHAVREHTIIGFLAHPKWGGNRDRAGWTVIGFQDRHAFEPPFGFYDDPKNPPEAK